MWDGTRPTLHQPCCDELPQLALSSGETVIGIFEHDDLGVHTNVLSERRDIGRVFVAVSVHAERGLADAADLPPRRREDVVVAARVRHVVKRTPAHETSRYELVAAPGANHG